MKHAASKMLTTATQEPRDHGKQPSNWAFAYQNVFDIDAGLIRKINT